jgi:hypothetical protein
VIQKPKDLFVYLNPRLMDALGFQNKDYFREFFGITQSD